MADMTIASYCKGSLMTNLLKIHMAVVIGILAFTLGVLGFFLVQFVDKVNNMDNKITTLDSKINTLDMNINLVANDTLWIKNTLIKISE